MSGLKLDARLIYLGLHGETELPGALSALHIITWKFVLIAFTRADTEGEKFDSKRVWRQAVRRFEVRLMAYSEGVRRWVLRYSSREGGAPPPPQVVDRHCDALTPCATVSEEGNVEWSDGFSDLLTIVSAEEEKVRARVRAKRARR